jgi:hypothetical protein
MAPSWTETDGSRYSPLRFHKYREAHRNMSSLVKLVLAPCHAGNRYQDDAEVSRLIAAGWRVIEAEPRIVEPGIPKMLVKLARDPRAKVMEVRTPTRSAAMAGTWDAEVALP